MSSHHREAADWMMLGLLVYCTVAFSGLAVAIVVCSIVLGPLIDAVYGVVIGVAAAPFGLMLAWEWRDA